MSRFSKVSLIRHIDIANVATKPDRSLQSCKPAVGSRIELPGVLRYRGGSYLNRFRLTGMQHWDLNK
ncbi:MAG: hypothetical protein OSA84_09590 [Akkermansiaceae bacterium]|nr:hypothetical protein [Akkermansiaceae bacterium]